MSDDRDRPRGPRRPPPQRPPRRDEGEYNDITWDDDDEIDEEALFSDPNLRGGLTLTDRIPVSVMVKVAAVVVPLIIFLIVVIWSRNQFDPPGSPGDEVVLDVPKGASITSFAKTLDEKDVVPSALAFRIWAKTHDAPQIQAGEYTFHTNSSAGQALAVLKTGPKTNTDRLVIPEGFRLEQIADRVGRIPGFSKQKFLDLANGGTIRSDFQPANVKSLEGFLFPDTYLLSASDNEEVLLKRMRNQFDTTARSVGLDRARVSIGHSPYEALIIASMIEAEARVPADRGKISQVIENRLAKSMTLGIDATILYGLGNTKSTLSKSDLERPGPYNTRLNKGLPPTPIGNPGRASLVAALAPTPGPWLYYVLIDANGSHAFATTLEEHNRNVAAARAKGLL